LRIEVCEEQEGREATWKHLGGRKLLAGKSIDWEVLRTVCRLMMGDVSDREKNLVTGGEEA